MKKATGKDFVFSVIIAIYNTEKFIEEAIQSVINQTLSFEDHIQLILVNDGSPDNSGEICKRFQKEYPDNIIYIEKENGGVSSARNAGLEVATGKYINYLDSDDYFTENAFEKVKEFFDKYSNKTDVVALNLINFENSSGSWVNGKYFEKTQLIDMEKEKHFMQCQVGASFIRGEKARKYRFDENIKIHEDSQYIYKIFRDKPFCGVISDATYWHRIRGNGTSATQNIKHKNNVFQMSSYLIPDLIDFYKQKYESIPSYLQTFIILEFNYYVLEKIADIELDEEEKIKLKKYVEKILSNLSIEDINNHPFVSDGVKRRYCILKNNINYLYNKSLLKNPEGFHNYKQKVKGVYRRARGFAGKVKRYLKSHIRFPFSRTVKKTIELENIVNTQTAEIEILKAKLSELTSGSGSKSIRSEINTISSDLKELKENSEAEVADIKNQLNYDYDKEVKYIYYFHSGSDNKGCEALLKTISACAGKKKENQALISFRKKEDIDAGITDSIKYIVQPKITDVNKAIYYMGNARFNFDDQGITDYIKNVNHNVIAFSIGGDNYCYGEYVNSLLAQYHRLMHNKGIKTALLGCSIEPTLLKNNNVLRDLDMYDLIIARESLTYNALIEAGIKKNTHLIPDTAFLLESKELPLPENFIEGETIGINMSPLVLDYSGEDNIVYKNYVNLVKHILNDTNYNITLIPHVFWDKTNDLEALQKLYDEFSYTNRLSIIGKHSCEELKGYIKRCKMFVGARTHSIVAAYSTCVPSLAVGYSIKSKGMALDIFGDIDNYVTSVQDFKTENDLTNSFKYIEKNYDKIKTHLSKKMPEYIKPLKDYKKVIEDLEKKEFQKSIPYDGCTGCGACLNVCPVGCIKFLEDEEGFKRPVIDYKKCIRCGKCINTCPVNQKSSSNKNVKAYAIKGKDDIRKNSSSGGVFAVMAQEILSKNGVVYGAAFDEKQNLNHIRITNKDDLIKLQGSKYLQSNTFNIYKDVKKDLENKKDVLFVGTPCQVKGLKSFLDKDYDNLYTFDIACHGVPSSKVFQKYVKQLEEENNSTVTNYQFRNKENGWKKYNTKVTFEDGKEITTPYDQDMYMRGFLRNIYLRKSCYQCSSNNFSCGSDLTLADYWGIDSIDPSFDDDKGVSLVTVNSKKGENLLDKVKEEFLEVQETDLSKALEYNKALIKPAFANKNRERFFDNLENIPIKENIEQNLFDEV